MCVCESKYARVCVIRIGVTLPILHCQERSKRGQRSKRERVTVTFRRYGTAEILWSLSSAVRGGGRRILSMFVSIRFTLCVFRCESLVLDVSKKQVFLRYNFEILGILIFLFHRRRNIMAKCPPREKELNLNRLSSNRAVRYRKTYMYY